MPEGFGLTALLCAVVSAGPAEIQRPKSQPSPPVQRPKTVVPAEAPSPPPGDPPEPETPSPQPRPANPPTPPLSAADREAEQHEFTEILEPLPEPDVPPLETRPAATVEPPPPPPRLDLDEIKREGVTIAAGVGASLCGHDWCKSYRGGLGWQLEAGYRFSRFMPHLSVDGGAGSDDRSVLEEQLQVPYGTLASSRTSFFGVGAGMTVFLKMVGRLDPYVTARFGYTRTRSRFGDYGGNEFSETVSRGSVRLGGGLDIFIGRNLAIGPRFDVTIGIRGRVCAEQLRAPETRECHATRNLEETARIYTNDLPVPVFVGAQVRAVIPTARANS